MRCAAPSCYPKQSDLTNSSFLSQLYSIQESTTFSDNETMSDLESARDDVVNELQSLKDEVEGNLQNMPDGLQQGDTGQMMQERIDALDEAINNLESADLSWDPPEREEGEKVGTYEQRKEAAEAERAAEVAEELQGYLEDISV